MVVLNTQQHKNQQWSIFCSDIKHIYRIKMISCVFDKSVFKAKITGTRLIKILRLWNILLFNSRTYCSCSANYGCVLFCRLEMAEQRRMSPTMNFQTLNGRSCDSMDNVWVNTRLIQYVVYMYSTISIHVLIFPKKYYLMTYRCFPYPYKKCVSVNLLSGESWISASYSK